MPGKVCSRCRKEKPLQEFGKSSGSKDGHRPDCRECRKAESKASQGRQNGRRSERWHTDPHYKAKQSERLKRYNGKALERMKAGAAVYSDAYVIAAIKRGTDLKAADIRQQPELIAAWRETMRTRKLIRKENEERKRVKRKADQAI